MHPAYLVPPLDVFMMGWEALLNHVIRGVDNNLNQLN